jgi:hypothetical protein
MVEKRDDTEGDEGILSPDELGVEDEEEVEEIDDNRFLVSTDSEGPEDTTVEDPAYFEPIEEGDGPDADEPLPPLSAIGEQYGVDVAVKAEGTVDSTRIALNKVVETLEGNCWCGTPGRSTSRRRPRRSSRFCGRSRGSVGDS